MTFNRLRIDTNDGSPVVEYRIENGGVERRTLEMAAEKSAVTEGEWQRFTPEQLASLVTANTVVAYWLSRRFGIHALIPACSKSSSSASNGTGGELAQHDPQARALCKNERVTAKVKE
jgi:hypothetical protein